MLTSVPHLPISTSLLRLGIIILLKNVKWHCMMSYGFSSTLTYSYLILIEVFVLRFFSMKKQAKGRQSD